MHAGFVGSEEYGKMICMLHISLDVLKRVSKVRLTSVLPTLVSARKQENGRMMFSRPSIQGACHPNSINYPDDVPHTLLAKL